MRCRLHVRRSDKVEEYANSVHELQEYLNETEKYYNQIQSLKNLGQNSLTKTIFLASDNTSILEQAKNMYVSIMKNSFKILETFCFFCRRPDWDIFGFVSTYSSSLKERKMGLVEIARDILLLAECDYVICGFSSNVRIYKNPRILCKFPTLFLFFQVCRLIFEMQSFKQFGNPKSIQSLDGGYTFNLLYHSLSNNNNNMKLRKIIRKNGTQEISTI